MEKQYVEKRNNIYKVAGTRVSADSVILAFLDRLSPETIAAECFPVLTLEQVYGVITYYLSHRSEFDSYLKQSEVEFEMLRRANNEPEFTQKMIEACRQMQMSNS